MLLFKLPTCFKHSVALYEVVSSRLGDGIGAQESSAQGSRVDDGRVASSVQLVRSTPHCNSRPTEPRETVGANQAGGEDLPHQKASSPVARTFSQIAAGLDAIASP
jgi:hypothetical protein